MTATIISKREYQWERIKREVDAYVHGRWGWHMDMELAHLAQAPAYGFTETDKQVIRALWAEARKELERCNVRA
jgi:hypothetical protein